jgi:hypothetical protein
MNLRKLLSGENISMVWAVGVVPSGLLGSGYGIWESLNQTRHESLMQSTIQATYTGLAGGVLGVMGWTVSPFVVGVLGISYIHKKYT